MYQSFVETVETTIVMITRPLILVVICFGFLILLQSLVPKVMALKRPSKVNEFMLEDQRTHKRNNYIIRLARENELLGNADNMATNYDSEPFQSEANPEEPSAFNVDYANMIRNDVILLDNSVETRTRKSGNIKVKKVNQAIPDPPCNCDFTRDTVDFGNNSFPRFVETRNCSKTQQTCLLPYICKENLYNLTILRREKSLRQSFLELPTDLKRKWIAERHPISVGCTCVRDYTIDI